MSSNKPTVVAILGMHRSGTSLVGQMLDALGLPMGDDLLAANRFNERGYFEDSVTVKIHDELLNALGRPWSGVRSTFPLPEDWLSAEETKSALKQLRDRIEKQTVGGIWAVKDPRMTRLFPMWQKLSGEMDFRLLTIVCVRSPDAVARSLRERDGIPDSMGELLWMMQNYELLKALDGSADCIVGYEDWFNKPEENLSRLIRVAGLKVDAEKKGSIISSVVATELRHHERAVGGNKSLPQVFYDLLMQWASSSNYPRELDSIMATVGYSVALFSPWYESQEEGYLAEMEKVHVEELSQLIQQAKDNYAAYQETEQKRLDAIAAYQEEANRVAHYMQAYNESERKRLSSICNVMYRIITFKWLKKK